LLLLFFVGTGAWVQQVLLYTLLLLPPLLLLLLWLQTMLKSCKRSRHQLLEHSTAL
jgi:hypothetical protein